MCSPIFRCTWCCKDVEENPCEHCENQTIDRTKPHRPEWSRASLKEVECKICDRRGPYSIQESSDFCQPKNMSSIQPAIPYLKEKLLNKPIRVIELGVRHADSALEMFKNLNVLEYHGIDPYETYEDYKTDGAQELLKSNADQIYVNAKYAIKNENDNYELHRNYSSAVADTFEDNIYDLIFCDANHTAKYVSEDIENYFPKLAKHGIMVFHDYFMRHKKNDYLKTLGGEYDEEMVFEAIRDFLVKNESHYGFTTFGKHREYPMLAAFHKC